LFISKEALEEPDGTQITFQSCRAGQDDIWVVDAPPPPTPLLASQLSA
jgi:hypothetical protein